MDIQLLVKILKRVRNRISDSGPFLVHLRGHAPRRGKTLRAEQPAPSAAGSILPAQHKEKQEDKNLPAFFGAPSVACAFGAKLCALQRVRTDIRKVSEEGMQTPPADVVPA